jgi:hypothetical protein
MDAIQRLDNLLTDDLLKSIEDEIASSSWKYGWRSNPSLGYSHWNIDYAKASSLNGLDVSLDLPSSIRDAWDYISETKFPNNRLIRCYANSHTFGVEGYPHTDSSRSGEKTIVLYLNKTWKREWGGETIIYDGDTIVHASLPAYNSALVFDGNRPHVSRGLTRICPELRISLMFKMCPNDRVDPNRDKIQNFLKSIGAEDTPHSSRTLSDHLLGTYDILKNANQSDDVCMAGAIHSIFGTNSFKHVTLSLDDRQIVENVVGLRACELAELFSKIARPQTLDRALSNNSTKVALSSGGELELPFHTIRDLAMIEGANLQEQGNPNRFPYITKVVEAKTQR